MSNQVDVTCEKIRFEGATAARMAILQSWKSQEQDWNLASYYYCKKCHGYHTTSKKPDGKTRLL